MRGSADRPTASGPAGEIATPCVRAWATKVSARPAFPAAIGHSRPVGGAGFAIKDVAEGHPCCGSVGTDDLLQPDLIATGNIGCMTQIGGGADLPMILTRAPIGLGHRRPQGRRHRATTGHGGAGRGEGRGGSRGVPAGFWRRPSRVYPTLPHHAIDGRDPVGADLPLSAPYQEGPRLREGDALVDE